MFRRSPLAFGFAACLSLSACQALDHVGSSLAALDFPDIDLNNKEQVETIPQGDCPAVSRVAELSSLYQFTNPDRPSNSSEVSESHITKVSSSCAKQGNNLKLDINANFDGGLGPKARMVPGDKPTFAYPYFVAITNGQNKILSKEIFAVSFRYDATSNLQMQTETLSQIVPLGGDDPRTYRILIGFQLSPEELAYNRKLPKDQLGKSLTIQTNISKN
jgi:hypothetical protein